MNTLTRLALIAAFAAAPLAACTQQEADNAADTTGDAANATQDAAGNVAAETRDTVDDATTTTEQTSVRAGEDGVAVENTETQR